MSDEEAEMNGRDEKNGGPRDNPIGRQEEAGSMREEVGRVR